MRRLALIVASHYEREKSEKWLSCLSLHLVRLSRVFLKVHYIRVCVTLFGLLLHNFKICEYSKEITLNFDDFYLLHY